jgi:NAD(P)H-dependent FMN reductase
MPTPRLLVVVASVRRERVGGAVADWYADVARADGRFEVTVADLRDGPGFYADTDHPGYQRYTSSELTALSAQVARADAVAVVSAEYNYFLPARRC